MASSRGTGAPRISPLRKTPHLGADGPRDSGEGDSCDSGARCRVTTTANRVRDYYDANTWKFLLTGGKRGIHRELWGPGVTNRAEAVDYAHVLVLEELPVGACRV